MKENKDSEMTPERAEIIKNSLSNYMRTSTSASLCRLEKRR